MTEPSTELSIFISHSSADRTVAKSLVELFEKALKLSVRQIRCTSLDGYKLPVGADTDEQLRREIFVSRSFVGVITPNSWKSAYVLFELGARWGAKRHLVPVLARGADAAILGGPLAGINALSLTARNDVLQLVQDVAGYLELPLEPMSSFQGFVDDVVVAATTVVSEPSTTPLHKEEVEVSDEEIAALRCLAAEGETTAAKVATVLKVSEQKAIYYLELLESKGMVVVYPVVYGVTTYGLRQAGRTFLVKRGLL